MSKLYIDILKGFKEIAILKKDKKLAKDIDIEIKNANKNKMK